MTYATNCDKMQPPAFRIFVARYFLDASSVRNLTSPFFFLNPSFFSHARTKYTSGRSAFQKYRRAGI